VVADLEALQVQGEGGLTVFALVDEGQLDLGAGAGYAHGLDEEAEAQVLGGDGGRLAFFDDHVFDGAEEHFQHAGEEHEQEAQMHDVGRPQRDEVPLAHQHLDAGALFLGQAGELGLQNPACAVLCFQGGQGAVPNAVEAGLGHQGVVQEDGVSFFRDAPDVGHAHPGDHGQVQRH
jgi:hypothetical protein